MTRITMSVKKRRTTKKSNNKIKGTLRSEQDALFINKKKVEFKYQCNTLITHNYCGIDPRIHHIIF